MGLIKLRKTTIGDKTERKKLLQAIEESLDGAVACLAVVITESEMRIEGFLPLRPKTQAKFLYALLSSYQRVVKIMAACSRDENN